MPHSGLFTAATVENSNSGNKAVARAVDGTIDPIMNRGLTGDAYHRHQQQLQEQQHQQQQQQQHNYHSSPSDGSYPAPLPDHINGAFNPHHAQEQADYSRVNSQQSDMLHYNPQQPFQMQQGGYTQEQLLYNGSQQPQLHTALEMLVQRNGMMSGMNGAMGGGMNGSLIGGPNNGAGQLQSVGSDVDQRKLVILGLPWDSSENTLHVRTPVQTYNMLLGLSIPI